MANRGGEHANVEDDRVERIARELAELTPEVAPRFLIDDSSPEKLVAILQEQGGRGSIMSPEGGLFGTIGGRYSGNGQPNMDPYLKGHAGDPIRVDRIGRESNVIDRPAVTIGLAVQPIVVAQAMRHPLFRGAGLTARFIYSFPRNTVGRRQIRPPAVPRDVRAAYDGNLRALLALPSALDLYGEPCPRILTLTDAAQRALMDYASEVEPMLAPDGRLGHIGDWAGKVVGAAARIAGLLHMADQAGAGGDWDAPIERSTVEAAVAIAGYATAHALIAFDSAGADLAAADARYLWRWIARQGGKSVSWREMQQDSRFHQDTDALKDAVDLLVEYGYLRQRDDESKKEGPGRRRSPTYDVNPLAAPQNPQNAADEHSGDFGGAFVSSTDAGGAGDMPSGGATIGPSGGPTDRRVDAAELAETSDWGTLALDEAGDGTDAEGNVTWTL